MRVINACPIAALFPAAALYSAGENSGQTRREQRRVNSLVDGNRPPLVDLERRGVSWILWLHYFRRTVRGHWDRLMDAVAPNSF
ncbi:unnamed protein product, partial [Iphiclides podalirius]